jgi:predicted nucleic acid-binding protein
MSGSDLVIDTNIALYLLDGDSRVAELLDGHHVFLSFVTELELLGFRRLTQREEADIQALITNCTVVDMTPSIKQEVIRIRRANSVKLPDAIIAATAITLGVPLLSGDKGFTRIDDLAFIQYAV